MTGPPRQRIPGWLDEVEVAVVQPYQATKVYRCPGCNRDIPAGTGHRVVVPVQAPDLRRHWHSGCWRQAERRTLNGHHQPPLGRLGCP